MKNLRLVLSIAVAALALAVIGYAGHEPGTGFTDSPHDFASQLSDQYKDNTTAIGGCTFCHTPHKALQTRLLWNHTLSKNDFSWSDSTSTVGGTLMPTISSATWKGPSKFCLSCHDGSVAIGDVNWFQEGNRNGSGITGENPPTTSPLNLNKHSTGVFNIASVGGDMKGNHPVAFPYPWYNGAVSTYNGVTTGNQLKSDLMTEGGQPEFNPDPTVLGIRLFSDTGSDVVAGPTTGKAGIECTSYHGIHNEPGFVQGDMLLRGQVTGDTTAANGYLCMKCHTR